MSSEKNDISKMIEAQLRLLLTTSQRIAGAKDFDESLTSALDTISEILAWKCVEVWLMRPGKGTPDLYKAHSESHLIAEGWVESVFLTSQAYWCCEKRSRTIVGIPVVSEGQVWAVLVFEVPPDHQGREPLVEVVQASVVTLGLWLARSKSPEDSQKHTRLQALFDNALDAILIADDNARYVDANPAACEMTGYSRSELLARTVWDLTLDPDMEFAPQTWKAFLEAGKLQGEYKLLGKDGVCVQVEFVSVANFVPGLHLSVLRDIAARIEAEAALHQAIAQLNDAQQLAQTGSWNWDILTNSVTWSEQLYRIWGVDSQTFVPSYEACLELIQPDEQERFAERVERAFVKHESNRSEFRVCCPNGQRRVIHSTLQCIVDEAGHVTRLFGTDLDITERHQAEGELRQQKELFQKIFDHVPIMIAFFDEQGQLSLVNREWQRVQGWSQEEVHRMGPNVWDALLPESRMSQHARDFIHAATGEWRDFQVKLRDGRVRDVNWAVVRLSDGNYIGIGHDVTELRQVEAERERLMAQMQAGRERLHALSLQLFDVQETERRHLARELHDEIGQSLTGLKLMLEALRRGAHEQQIDTISLIQTIVADLLGDVRNLSLQLRPYVLDDLGLLPALLWHFERYTAQTGIHVDFFQTNLDGIRFEHSIETVVYRVVQEALTNVARYAGVHRVQVRIGSELHYLSLEVEDRGKGFDVEKVLNSKISGGLTGMRERVFLLGGELKILSELGRGTQLLAKLPGGNPLERREKQRKHDNNRIG